jgi:hypothetical protein
VVRWGSAPCHPRQAKRRAGIQPQSPPAELASGFPPTRSALAGMTPAAVRLLTGKGAAYIRRPVSPAFHMRTRRFFLTRACRACQPGKKRRKAPGARLRARRPVSAAIHARTRRFFLTSACRACQLRKRGSWAQMPGSGVVRGADLTHLRPAPPRGSSERLRRVTQPASDTLGPDCVGPSLRPPPRTSRDASRWRPSLSRGERSMTEVCRPGISPNRVKAAPRAEAYSSYAM